MTESEREDYQNWRHTKAALRTATLEFASAVGEREPEGSLLALAHEVARLQGEERRTYSALSQKLTWRRLAGVTTWPTPLGSAFGDI